MRQCSFLCVYATCFRLCFWDTQIATRVWLRWVESVTHGKESKQKCRMIVQRLQTTTMSAIFRGFVYQVSVLCYNRRKLACALQRCLNRHLSAAFQVCVCIFLWNLGLGRDICVSACRGTRAFIVITYVHSGLARQNRAASAHTSTHL